MNTPDNRLVVLEVGLFPDGDTVRNGVEMLAEGRDVRRHDLTSPALSEQGWDQVVDDILSARKVITI